MTAKSKRKVDAGAVYAYELKRARLARKSAEQSEAGRDIGPVPAVADQARRASSRGSLRFHCETYHAPLFSLAWSDDHLRLIGELETIIKTGGQKAFAMPRASGKTTLVEVAVEWAILHGYRHFVALIGSTEAHAEGMLESIKAEFEQNELLLADFPEAIFPIQELDREVRRCNAQTSGGRFTLITWKAREIVLPTIPGSPSSGAVVKAAGLTGHIRGMKHKLANGSASRPDLALLDDPQTDESAKSVTQSEYRAAVISGTVLYLSGPGKKIAALIPCTVIRQDDLADRLLNRDKHPEWNGERTRMVLSFPENDKLWDEYRAIRAEAIRAGDRYAFAATNFYRENRAEMDRGAAVYWPARFNEDEISAIQHAMNLLIADKAAFWAEAQNAPLAEAADDVRQLTTDDVARKLNGLPRLLCPSRTAHVTGFIDIQQRLLYYVLVAWLGDFSGYVIDYGTWPDQKRNYFSARDARKTLALLYKGHALAASIYAGLRDLCDLLFKRDYKCEDGSLLKIGRLLIDQNWGKSTDTVRRFCRESTHRALLTPSNGKYVGAKSRRITDPENKQHRKQLRGLNWRFPDVSGPGEARHATWDTNYWKTKTAEGFLTPHGDKGSISLWGRSSADHLLFAEQCSSEFPTVVEGPFGKVEEWQLRPARDNHFWDGVVGCGVGASILGLSPPGLPVVNRARQPRRSRRVSALKC